MKYQFITLLIALLFHSMVYAQSFFITRNGTIQFFSKTPLEDIKAVNKNVYSSLNTATGSLQFLVQIPKFEFRYSAMRNHFNDEDYMDSPKYPTADFKGKITDLSAIDFTKDGSYNVNIEGSLTIHGVTKTINTPASITVNKGQITGATTFSVKIEDYNIVPPKIVFKKIAEIVEVTVNCLYSPYKN
jgi:polyisoprenoid-binding protein YceI